MGTKSFTSLIVAGFFVVVAGADEWTPLFDGKSLDGWVQHGGKAQYRVEDGCIVGKSVANTTNSFLCTRKDYGDFVLEFEFKVAPTLNSGVQFRSQVFDRETELIVAGKPKKIPADRVHGYQYEIDPAKRAWTGGIYDEGRRGWLVDLKNNPAGQRAFKQNQWNAARIECKGDKIKTWLNGVPTAELTDSMTTKGLIGLQVHSVSKNGTLGAEVRWRNLRIQTVGETSTTSK